MSIDEIPSARIKAPDLSHYLDIAYANKRAGNIGDAFVFFNQVYFSAKEIPVRHEAYCGLLDCISNNGLQKIPLPTLAGLHSDINKARALVDHAQKLAHPSRMMWVGWDFNSSSGQKTLNDYLYVSFRDESGIDHLEQMLGTNLRMIKDASPVYFIAESDDAEQRIKIVSLNPINTASVYISSLGQFLDVRNLFFHFAVQDLGKRTIIRSKHDKQRIAQSDSPVLVEPATPLYAGVEMQDHWFYDKAFMQDVRGLSEKLSDHELQILRMTYADYCPQKKLILNLDDLEDSDLDF